MKQLLLIIIFEMITVIFCVTGIGLTQTYTWGWDDVIFGIAFINLMFFIGFIIGTEVKEIYSQ